MPNTSGVCNYHTVWYRARVAAYEGEAVRRWLPGNVRRHRDRKGLSRAQLAAAMAERGHKWHPTTVDRIEAGTQVPNVAELADLAAILGTIMDRLMWAEGDDAAQVLAGQAIGRLRDAAEAVTDSVARLRAAEAGAESAIRGLRHGKPTERAVQAADHVEEALEGTSLEDAIAAGEDRWEELRGGA